MSGSFNLVGRRILVTGAARGLGFEFTRALVSQGASVVIADVNASGAEHAASQMKSEGGEAHAVQVDLRDPASIRACVDTAQRLLSGLDGLINNAAITNSGGRTMEEIELEAWDKTMEVNVRGQWLMSVACLPALKDSGRGSIVNMSSDTILWGATKLLAYVASKGAVAAMTRSMARELGEFNITVNSIGPGLTISEANEYVPVDRHELYVSGRAISRPQQPSDLSGTIVYLMSDLSRFVTGQFLAVNGGFVTH